MANKLSDISFVSWKMYLGTRDKGRGTSWRCSAVIEMDVWMHADPEGVQSCNNRG